MDKVRPIIIFCVTGAESASSQPAPYKYHNDTITFSAQKGNVTTGN